MDIKKVWLLRFVNFFYKKSAKGKGIKNETKQNEKLGEELHKPIIREL